MKPWIAIIGEYHNTFEPHFLLNTSLDYLREDYRFAYGWIGKERVAREKDPILKEYAGIWSAPESL